MAVTNYKVYDFDYDKAIQGYLVAMVKKTTDNNAVVSSAPETGNTPTFKGTGIVKARSQNDLLLIINSINYSFNAKGECVSSDFNGDNGYKLMLAVTMDKTSEIGSVVETDGTTTITRSISGGSVEYHSEVGQSSVVVSTLEARDQFAIHALKTLMERLDKDPSTVSDNEMSFLCENAYKWAANMMTQASKVRATVTTEDSGGEPVSVTQSTNVDISELTNTTDKLLNNIVAAIEKTDESEVTGENNENIEYSERVSIPKLIAWLEKYSSHTPTDVEDTQPTVGLDDLINAIKAINVDIDTTSLAAAINAPHTNNIGDGGLGRDANHPIYIEGGGGFPSRQILPASFTSDTLHDFLTFNAAGAVGYSTKDDVKDAIYNSLQTTIDARIGSWLQAARITVDGTVYSLTVNTPT